MIRQSRYGKSWQAMASVAALVTDEASRQIRSRDMKALIEEIARL